MCTLPRLYTAHTRVLPTLLRLYIAHTCTTPTLLGYYIAHTCTPPTLLRLYITHTCALPNTHTSATERENLTLLLGCWSQFQDLSLSGDGPAESVMLSGVTQDTLSRVLKKPCLLWVLLLTHEDLSVVASSAAPPEGCLLSNQVPPTPGPCCVGSRAEFPFSVKFMNTWSSGGYSLHI